MRFLMGGRPRMFLLRSSCHGATVLLAALALTPAACGSGSGGGLAFDDLEGSLVAALCDFEVLCGSMPNRATCLASERTQQSFLPTMRTDIASGLVKYDALAARRCVNGFAALRTCSSIAIAVTFKELDVACNAVFTGTVAPGDTCYFDEECAAHGVCTFGQCPSTTCCAGTCTAAPAPIPLGGDCTTASGPCVDGAVCGLNAQGTTPLLVCLKVAGPGEACTTATPCQSPYACVTTEATAASSSCIAPSGSGQTCGTATTSFCDDERESCDTTTKRCTPHIAVGGTCDPASAVSCVGYATCTLTTCVALGGPGDSCDPATGALQECLGSLECDFDTRLCALPPASASCR